MSILAKSAFSVSSRYVKTPFAPLLVLLPAQPASLGLRGVPLCEGVVDEIEPWCSLRSHRPKANGGGCSAPFMGLRFPHRYRPRSPHNGCFPAHCIACKARSPPNPLSAAVTPVSAHRRLSHTSPSSIPPAPLGRARAAFGWRYRSPRRIRTRTRPYNACWRSHTPPPNPPLP